MLKVILRREPPPLCPSNHLVTIVKNVEHGECQKNQALNVGGLSLDGCMEFFPSGAEGTAEALICGACGCHKNFHRREIHINVICRCPSANV